MSRSFYHVDTMYDVNIAQNMQAIIVSFQLYPGKDHSVWNRLERLIPFTSPEKEKQPEADTLYFTHRTIAFNGTDGIINVLFELNNQKNKLNKADAGDNKISVFLETFMLCIEDIYSARSDVSIDRLRELLKQKQHEPLGAQSAQIPSANDGQPAKPAHEETSGPAPLFAATPNEIARMVEQIKPASTVSRASFLPDTSKARRPFISDREIDSGYDDASCPSDSERKPSSDDEHSDNGSDNDHCAM